MRRVGKTIAELEAEREQRQRDRAAYFRQLQKQDFERKQQRAAEEAEEVLEAYRERHPRPPALDPNAAGHAPAAPDTRLGSLRRNPKARPLVPLPPPQDLGGPPAGLA